MDKPIIVRRISSEHTVTKINHYIHNNEGHEIYILLKGNVSFHIDESLYQLEPSDMLLISNQETHRTIVDNNSTYERMYIYFSNDYLSKFDILGYDLLSLFRERSHGVSNKIPKCLVEKYDLLHYFVELHEWYESESEEKHVMMLSLLLSLLVKINKVHKEVWKEEDNIHTIGNSYNERVYEIIKYISANLHSKITLSHIEKKFYVDRHYICRLFKSVTGFTILDYINYKKVNSAKEHIRAGKNISEVWIQYGYMNYSSFYRVFKKIEGIAPQEYGNQYKKCDNPISYKGII